MAEINYSVGGVLNGGVAPSEGVDTEFPLVVMATAGGNAKFKLADDIFLNIETGLWTGYNNQILDRSAANQSTALRWYEDRYAVFQTRTPFSPEDNVFGINELSMTLMFAAAGLSLKVAPFSAIEKLAYPYAHNASSGGFQSLQLAGFDTNSPADVYNPYIGPMAAIYWDLPWVPGLQLLYQVGTAGAATEEGFAGAMDGTFDFSKLFHTAQVKYTTPDLGNGTTLTAAAYLTNKNPVADTTATGEKVSDTLGAGFGLMLNIPGTLAANFGYSFNKTGIDGEGVSIESRFDGINLSVDVPVLSYLDIALGYSWLGFTEDTKAFINQTEETSEHAFEAKVVVPFLSNFAATAGYRGTFVDERNTLNPIGGDRHVFSLGLQGVFGGSL